MLSRWFEDLFVLLCSARRDYDDAPRNPETVPELGAARCRLDDARELIHRERVRLTAAHRAPAPRPRPPNDHDAARLRVQGMISP